MRNIFRTQTQALAADIACWLALVGLLICVGVNAENEMVAGITFTVAALLGTFALFYNGRNLSTVVRAAVSSARYRREEEVRHNEYERQRDEQTERDAAYGRDLRDLNHRHLRG